MFKKERKYVALIRDAGFGPEGLNNEEKIVRQWEIDNYEDAINYVNLKLLTEKVIIKEPKRDGSVLAFLTI